MVQYLIPYGVDMGSFFGNFGGTFDLPLENGVKAVRLAPLFSAYTVRNNPLNLMAIDPLHWNNPYPAPMTADKPGPGSGDYRPEERRVGKECVCPCISRCSPYHTNNKTS